MEPVTDSGRTFLVTVVIMSMEMIYRPSLSVIKASMEPIYRPFVEGMSMGRCPIRRDARAPTSNASHADPTMWVVHVKARVVCTAVATDSHRQKHRGLATGRRQVKMSPS